jgi:hypothetical protein
MLSFYPFLMFDGPPLKVVSKKVLIYINLHAKNSKQNTLPLNYCVPFVLMH